MSLTPVKASYARPLSQAFRLSVEMGCARLRVLITSAHSARSVSRVAATETPVPALFVKSVNSVSMELALKMAVLTVRMVSAVFEANVWRTLVS